MQKVIYSWYSKVNTDVLIFFIHGFVDVASKRGADLRGSLPELQFLLPGSDVLNMLWLDACYDCVFHDSSSDSENRPDLEGPVFCRFLYEGSPFFPEILRFANAKLVFNRSAYVIAHRVENGLLIVFCKIK